MRYIRVLIQILKNYLSKQTHQKITEKVIKVSPSAKNISAKDIFLEIDKLLFPKLPSKK